MLSFLLNKPERIVDLKSVRDYESDTLGDKGAALARMIKNDLTVPNGFVICTQISREWSVDRTKLTAETRNEIFKAVINLEKSTGREFFDYHSKTGKITPSQGPLPEITAPLKLPLLLSVRESPLGAAPDTATVLNLGMNKSVMERMRSITGRPLFVLDTYRRFLFDWGTKMKKIPKESYQTIVDETVKRLGLRSAHSNKPFILHVNQLSYNETEILVKKFEQITGEYPSDPAEQLFSVLESMYGSYYSISARTFRASRGCKTSGVALICQAMVMGNLTTLSSGSGTVHSRNPQTGSSSISGTFYSRSEGVADDDVVHGTRAIDIGKELNDRMPDIYMQLESCARLLERDFKDGVSLDFTIESGTIYYLNVYQCSRSPEAAIKIAVDMTGDPTLISSVLSGGDCLKPPVISRKEAVLRAPVDAMPDGLDPMWVRSEYATKLLEWSDTYRSMTVMTNCSSAGDAQASSLLKADGIGKLDMEDLIIATRNKGVMHSFSTSVTPEQRTAALHLLAGNLQEQVSEILYVAPGVNVLPAQKRTASQQENEPISNIMTQQERQHQQEKLVVVNALLYDSTTAHAFVLLPEFLECQVSAICRAVLEAQDSIGLLFEINFSLPVLISDHELDYMVPHMKHCIKDACDEYDKQCQKKLVEAEEEESKSMLSYGTGRRMVLQSNFDKGIKCNFGVCISTPRACIRAASLVSSGVVQFVVFDVEALTAATFGVKREESATFMDQYIKKHILSVNPFINLDQHGVGALIARAIEDIHRARPGVNDTTASGEKAGHVKCVAFGPQVENAASVRYLFSIGMDVISVDTKAIPMAKCAAAQASIEAQMRESGKLAGWWGDAWKALDNAMFDEGNMLIA